MLVGSHRVSPGVNQFQNKTLLVTTCELFICMPSPYCQKQSSSHRMCATFFLLHMWRAYAIAHQNVITWDIMLIELKSKAVIMWKPIHKRHSHLVERNVYRYFVYLKKKTWNKNFKMINLIIKVNAIQNFRLNSFVINKWLCHLILVRIRTKK